MFFTTLYCPNFRSKPYLTVIEQKLQAPKTLNWDHDQYLKLLNLKKHASLAADSLSQLNSLFDESTFVNSSLPTLENSILKAINIVLNGQTLPLRFEKHLIFSFSVLKNSMEENRRQKPFSFLNLVTNSITTIIGVGGICIAAFAISTGGIGVIALGIGMALVATAIALLAAYSLYVDGRFLASKQVEEIDSFINTLIAYKEPKRAPATLVLIPRKPIQVEGTDDNSEDESSNVVYEATTNTRR